MAEDEPKLFGREAFLNHLLGPGDGSLTLEDFRQIQAFEAAQAGSLEWETAITIVRSTYSNGATRPISNVIAMRTQNVALPDFVRREVLQHPEQYPIALWRIVERTVSAEARKRIRSVISVAQSEGWTQIGQGIATSGTRPARSRNPSR